MQAALAFGSDGDHVHRNMARGRVMFEQIEDDAPVAVWQMQVERDRRGLDPPGQRDSRMRSSRDDDLEIPLARAIGQHVGEVAIVFDDQQHRIAFGDVRAIVLHQVRFHFSRSGLCAVWRDRRAHAARVDERLRALLLVPPPRERPE